MNLSNSTESDPATRYPIDYRFHSATRQENDRRLLPIANKIESGDSIENLERFAKAYLGMYLDMDNSIPPQDRIPILANPELTALIYRGFEAVLLQNDHASAAQIAESLYTKEIPQGYILLAAISMFHDKEIYAVKNLPDASLIAITCYQYAYLHEINSRWQHELFMQRPQQAIAALSEFWQHLIDRDTNHLPGVYQILDNRDYGHIAKHVLLPVLQTWTSVRKKLLRDLLRCALRNVDHESLYRVCEVRLSNTSPADPGRYMLWLASAFLLQPDSHRLQLFDYTGRSKEKLIPLLDFIYWLFHTDQLTSPQPPAHVWADLIQLIAAKITPQKDRYGELCANTRRVMFLFFSLAQCPDKQAAISRLAKVRVMKLYKAILDFVRDYNPKPANEIVAVRHDEFLRQLTGQGLIQPRVKWYD